jgi:hypothetical protein
MFKKYSFFLFHLPYFPELKNDLLFVYYVVYETVWRLFYFILHLF